nr:MAG: hypothetical protein [Bacteriophage sp.]
MTDYNLYMIMDAITCEKVKSALHIAHEMAKESYPHLVDEIDFAISRMVDNTETFVGSQNKPKTKKAYKKGGGK